MPLKVTPKRPVMTKNVSFVVAGCIIYRCFRAPIFIVKRIIYTAQRVRRLRRQYRVLMFKEQVSGIGLYFCRCKHKMVGATVSTIIVCGRLKWFVEDQFSLWKIKMVCGTSILFVKHQNGYYNDTRTTNQHSLTNTHGSADRSERSGDKK